MAHALQQAWRWLAAPPHLIVVVVVIVAVAVLAVVLLALLQAAAPHQQAWSGSVAVTKQQVHLPSTVAVANSDVALQHENPLQLDEHLPLIMGNAISAALVGQVEGGGAAAARLHGAGRDLQD
jgi:hypothetical protein